MTWQALGVVLRIWVFVGAVAFLAEAVAFGEEMNGPWRGWRFWGYLFLGGPFMWILVGLVVLSDWVEGVWRKR